jgi:hypothetical protein
MRDFKGEEQDPTYTPTSPGTAWDNPPGATNTDPYRPPYVRTAATLGPPVPLVWGTERVRATAIYARGKTFAPDNECWVRVEDPQNANLYTLERTDTTAMVLALCEAPASGSITIVRGWRDGGTGRTTPSDWLVAWTGGSATASSYVLGGTATSPAFLTGSAVGAAWQGMCQFRAEKFAVPGGKIPGVEFELACPTADGLSGSEAYAWSVVKEILTDATRGLGLLGSDGTAATVVDVSTGLDGATASGYATYCANSGLGHVSRKVEEATSARELLQDLFEATNATVVPSNGRIKVIPLAEEAVGTYVPASTSVLIDDDELLHVTGRDTVTLEITPRERTYNTFPISFRNRDQMYREDTVEYIEPADAEHRGVRRAPRRFNAWIKTPEQALRFSALLARRSLSIRRKFRFRLSPRWIALEPGDLIALSHAKLGLVEEPVRIVAIEEDASGVLEVFAEEWPAGLSKIVDLTPETQDGLLSVAPNPYIGIAKAQTTADGKADPDLGNVTPGSVVAPLLDDPVVEPINRSLTGLAQSSDGNRVWYRGNDFYVQGGRPVLMDDAWVASTAYLVNDRRLKSGNVYICTQAGTSGTTGPSGTGTNITDGTARWDYIGTTANHERLQIVNWRGHSLIGGGLYLYSLEVTLYPKSSGDNLDALRRIEFEVYDNAGNWKDTFFTALPDRGYVDAIVDAQASNGTTVSAQWLGPQCTAHASSYLDAYVRVTVWNAFGSNTRVYRSQDSGTAPAVGGASITGVPAPPAPPPDGETGGNCPAPETLILLADGTTKPAGALVVGDVVRTRHEVTGEWGDYPVAAVSLHDSERLRVALHDGRELVASPDHRVFSHGAFRHIRHLAPQFMVEGAAPGRVVAVEPAAFGPVVQITVDDAHTYVSAGLLSHNAKRLDDP